MVQRHILSLAKISAAKLSFSLVVLGLGLAPQTTHADTVHVAVAANFTDAAREMAAAFHTKTGHEAVLSFGASGQLTTQILQGAPYEILLSADQARPEQLVRDGLGLGETRFTYAIGKLVLWSPRAEPALNADTLRKGGFTKLAICDPAAAPYGAAAVETLKALNLTQATQTKLVQGANITQAYQFVSTGNAELGFVALSQVINDHTGARWMVPQELYTPIKQDAVLLRKGADNVAARAFLAFLKSPDAKAIVTRYGYDTDPRVSM